MPERLTAPRPRLADLLGVGAAVVLALSVVPWPTALQGRSLCLMRTLTGLPCPGCGLTRSFRGIAHGDFAGAWAHHPFGYPLFAATIAVALAPVWTRLWPGSAGRLGAHRGVRVAVVVWVVALFVFGFARLALLLAR